MLVKEHCTPFYHSVVDNFLTDDQFEKICDIYSLQEFKEIHTDLYRFLQTGELCQNDEIGFFKDRLDEVFSKHYGLDKRYYNFFGSYFRAGDGLLVHDDLIGNRVFAFAFYLNDFQTGDFLIYENDCVTLNKRVSVRKNRLLFFKVGEFSFHEVETSRSDGRMAIAGWFSIADTKVPVSTMKSFLFIPSSIQYYELAMPVPGPGEMQIVPFEDANTTVLRRVSVGPYIYRRYTRIEQEVLYVPRLDGYELIHAECIHMDDSGYILCNDVINDVIDGIIDIFVFNDESEETPNLITYVGRNGDKAFALDAVPGHMIIGPRDGHALCVMRSDKNSEFKHFIYKKIS